MRRTVLVVSMFLLTACGPVVSAGVETPTEPWVPAIEYPEPAHEGSPGAFTCWDQYGVPLPQSVDTCSDGFGGRPPENPVPVDITKGAPVP